MSHLAVLGLGGNLGDRLARFIEALRRLQSRQILTGIRCSELFESEALLLPGAPRNWNIPFFNIAASGHTPLTPRALLAAIKQIEQELGREKRERWAPREIDIDILIFDSERINEADLKIPHAGLGERPFALWPLAALAPHYPVAIPETDREHAAITAATRWGCVRDSVPCRTWRADNRSQNLWQDALASLQIPLTHGPLAPVDLVGVINVTPDSFSDGGKFVSAEEALEQAKRLYREGASVLDIGAESTRPSALPLTPEEEWARLGPALEAIKGHFASQQLRPLLSVDTRHAEVAARAIEAGVDWINDVTGLQDSAMLHQAAQSECDCVVMHSLGIPPSKERILDTSRPSSMQVLEWGEETIKRLENAGISRKRIILDPGIGFGKSAEQSAELIAHAADLQRLGTRILIGHSRKSFQTLFTSRPAAERDPETAILSALLAREGVHYLRVHDVAANLRAMNLLCRPSN